MGWTANAIAEGVSIAASAARMAVRNRILVETIARGNDFDPVWCAEFAQETLRGLADEQTAAAAMVRAHGRRAIGKFSDSDGTHDYRDRDKRNLRRRKRQYLGVAAQLRKMADDPAQVVELVRASRAAAWGDVESNLTRRLRVEGMRAETDPDYHLMRAARMDALRRVDLARLAAQTRIDRDDSDD